MTVGVTKEPQQIRRPGYIRMIFGSGATILGFERWGSPTVGVRKLTPTVMPIHFGTPMDENPFGADPIVIFTATYGLYDGFMRVDGEDCEPA